MLHFKFQLKIILESLEDLVVDDFDVSCYINFELKQEEKKHSIETVIERYFFVMF